MYVVVDHLPHYCIVFICVHMSSFICSVDRHLSCFYFLAVRNRATTNIFCSYLLVNTYAFPLGIYVGMEFLGHRVYRCFTLLGTANRIPKWLN